MIHDWDQGLDDLENAVRQAADDIRKQRLSYAEGYDSIVVPGDLSGTIMGAPLSLVLRKPLVIVRMHSNKCARHSKHIIGDAVGKRLLYVDDQISTGTTFRHVRDAIQEAGGRVVASYEYQFRDFTSR